jgi:hypothetical protein
MQWRTRAIALALCLSCLAGTSDARNFASRIRTLEPDLQALLADGYRRSPTLQRLAGDLARTDGIVYIRSGRCPVPSLRACLLHSIHQAGHVRYLWIRISPGKDNEAELLATLAHELQHALEVLGQPWIRTQWDVVTFYQSVESGGYRSTPNGGPLASYETRAALDISGRVRAELTSAEEATGDVER